MRKLVLAIALVCLSAVAALAQGKISSSWSCPKPSPGQTYQVGDKPNHSYGVSQFGCKATAGEIAKVKEKQGTGTEFAEMTGESSSGHGVFVATMENGDHVHYAYTTTATWKKDQMVSGSNKFELKGGTGKFKDVKGSGACTGKGNKDGSSTWTCTGTYSGVK